MKPLGVVLFLLVTITTNAQDRVVKAFYLQHASIRFYTTNNFKWGVAIEFKSIRQQLPCIISVVFRGKSVKQIEIPVDSVSDKQIMLVTTVSARKYPNIDKATCYIIDEEPPKERL